jgi:hypothetical protein
MNQPIDRVGGLPATHVIERRLHDSILPLIATARLRRRHPTYLLSRCVKYASGITAALGSVGLIGTTAGGSAATEALSAAIPGSLAPAQFGVIVLTAMALIRALMDHTGFGHTGEEMEAYVRRAKTWYSDLHRILRDEPAAAAEALVGKQRQMIDEALVAQNIGILDHLYDRSPRAEADVGRMLDELRRSYPEILPAGAAPGALPMQSLPSPGRGA